MFVVVILQVPEEPGLVSLATHPFSEQLLALDNKGGVYSIEVANTGNLGVLGWAGQSVGFALHMPDGIFSCNHKPTII